MKRLLDAGILAFVIFTIDENKSSVRLRTFAEGLLARLAHDLELICRGITGTGERLGEDRGSATIEVPIHRITVNGTLKDGRLEGELKPSEREDAVEKMRKDVFHTQDPNAVVRIEATLEAGKARIRVIPPKGKTVERPLTTLRISDEANDEVRVSGEVAITLSSIGADAIKGPMNAFRVKDTVEVLFDIVFRANQPA